MNPDLPDPIFLPPLHFSNERAYDKRKSSLPSLHGDFGFVSKRKLSLPWATEEIVTEKQENSSSISTGNRVSARILTPLPSSNSDVFDNSTPKSEIYSLPGQLCEETTQSKSSASTSTSSRSRSATLSSKNKYENDKGKWQDVIASLKNETDDERNRKKIQTKSNSDLPVTEQPTANKLLPFSTTDSSFAMNLVRKLPNLLSGSSDPLSTFPRLNSDSIAPKDINVNMRHAANDVRRDDPDFYSKDHRPSCTTLLPNENNGDKHQVTCPNCGEKFQHPPHVESKTSGCTGTLSTICTYAAMAGVLLVGCVHLVQNVGTGSQLPGGELRSFLPSRRAR